MVKTAIGIDSGSIDLVEVLLRGPEAWNRWRAENPKAYINLRGANLRGANLRGANLCGANLIGANLCGADLRGVNLRGANLFGANLFGANLSKADLRGVKLFGANISRANLFEADLREANLRGANLFGADLREANLFGADLREAEANLFETDIRKASLFRADLNRTYLHEARTRGNLRTENLDQDPKINNSAIDSIPEETEDNSSDFDKLFQIKIYDQEIPPATLVELKQAIENYAEAFGYEEPEVLEEWYGSWFKKVRYEVAKFISPEDIDAAVEDGKDLYRRGLAKAKTDLARTEVESTQKMAEATAILLKAVESTDNTVLCLGKLILIKQTTLDGYPRTYVRSISSELQHRLEQDPDFFDSPEKLTNALKVMNELPEAVETRALIPPSQERGVSRGIEKTAGVCGGSACVAGTRITVWGLVESQRQGYSEADLLISFPTLNATQLANAWAYAESFPEEIEAEIQENNAVMMLAE